jgi:hypothetical protein
VYGYSERDALKEQLIGCVFSGRGEGSNVTSVHNQASFRQGAGQRTCDNEEVERDKRCGATRSHPEIRKGLRARVITG